MTDISTSPGRLLDARDVAAELFPKMTPGAALRRLRGMAERGEYPELLHVTRGEYRVRTTDHEAWEQGRWTLTEKARADLAWERAREKLSARKERG